MKLSEAYASACAYWDSLGTSSRMMGIRAKACMDIVGPATSVHRLTPADATRLLTALGGGRSRVTVQSYYAAFKRMVELAGGSTLGWPKAPKPARKLRNVASMGVSADSLERTRQRLLRKGWQDTALLLQILMNTGMRVDVEALDWDAWGHHAEGLLRITGKGGHEREVPVSDNLLTTIRERAELVKQMRRTPYNTHYKRLREIDPQLGFHDVRRWYATEAYKRSGKDLRVVQELLGHADVSTTAGYVGVSMEDLRNAAY